MKSRLYVSHFLTSWTDRVFDFACFLLIAEAFPVSLLYPSVYGFATTISAILFSSHVGNLVDTTPRLTFVRHTLLVQKASIVTSCLLFYALFQGWVAPVGLYVGIITCGCLLKLAFIANNIAIEKDWVLVIAEGDTASMLTTMKRIDLFCKTVAPVLIGALLAFGPAVGVVIIAAWNATSFFLEYQLCRQTFLVYPALASKNAMDNERAPLLDDAPSTSASPPSAETRVTLMAYLRHRVFPASFAIALLYLTVLSFGGIMVSYLNMIGYSQWSIGLLRAIAGLAGVASTYVFPFLSSKIGVIRTGVWAVWFECFTLVPVVLSLTAVFQGSVAGSIMLFGGMSVSRIGLWLFDIAVTILLQQLVDPAQLGGVAGWQHSFCSMFDLSQYILTALVPNPADFIIPSAVSLFAVFCACISYTIFVKQERGHLLHLKKRV
ncbi:Ferroporti-1 [Gongronella butleri]|nr:Ferroporti-1 [Gongronella butleri]